VEEKEGTRDQGVGTNKKCLSVLVKEQSDRWGEGNGIQESAIGLQALGKKEPTADRN
jgi:hypothetical protein